MWRDQSEPRASVMLQITDQKSPSYFPEDYVRLPKILEDEDDLTTIQMRGKLISSKYRSSSRALRSDIIDQQANGSRKNSHNKFNFIYFLRRNKKNVI